MQLCLCQLCNQHVPGLVIGTQFYNGVWSIWLSSVDTRLSLANNVNHLHVNNRDVPLYNIYPLAKANNVPNGVSDDDLMGNL